MLLNKKINTYKIDLNRNKIIDEGINPIQHNNDPLPLKCGVGVV